MPEFNPLTAKKEDLLAQMKLLNEDLKKLKITPMTESQMEQIANDTERLELYRDAQIPLAEINAREEFKESERNNYETTRALARIHHYILDYHDNDEARANNKKITDDLHATNGEKEYLETLYNALIAVDETEYFADDERDMLKIYSENVGTKMLYYELKNIFSTASEFPKPLDETVESNRFSEKIAIFENIGAYVGDIKALGNPYNVIFPELSVEDLLKLANYYQRNNEPEKKQYVDLKIINSYYKSAHKYTKTAANMLKEKGFMGVDDRNTTYSVYNENGDKLDSRASGFEALLSENKKFVRIVKHTKGAADQEMTLTREEVINTYYRNNLDKNLEKVYPDYKNIKFSDDLLLRNAQKVAILRKFPKTSGEEVLKDIDKRKVDRFIQSVLAGEEPTVSYVMSHSKDVAEKMIDELANVDDPLSPRYKRNFNRYDANLGHNNAIFEAGKVAFDSIFASKTDSTDVHYIYQVESAAGKSYVSQEILKAQKEIDETVINVPVGFTEEDVMATTFAYFLSKDNMKKNMELLLKAKGENSSLGVVTDPVYDAGEFVVDNMFKNDRRINGNMVRTLVPDARRKANEVINNLTEENAKKLAQDAKDAINFAVELMRIRANMTGDVYMRLSRMVNGLYDVLEKTELKDKVSFNENELQWKKLIRTNTKLAREMIEYENKIYKITEENKIAKDYLGKEYQGKPSDNPELKEAFLEYEARKLYFERCSNSYINYEDGVAKKFGVGTESETRKYNRPISRVETNCMNNPEEYIKYMKNQVEADSYNYKQFLEEKGYDHIMSTLSNNVENNGYELNIEYVRQWVLGSMLTEFTNRVKDKPEYADLVKEINELPCMKNPDDMRMITGEECENQVKLYQDIKDKIKATKYRGKMPLKMSYDTRDLEQKMDRVIKGMVANNKLYRAEKTYENERFVESVKKPEIKIEDAEKIIIDNNYSYNVELAEYDFYMDYATKENYQNLINNLIYNAENNEVKDESFNSIVDDIRNCFGSGAEETELILASSKLEKLTEELSEKMLDDDSDALREKFAFVVNLQSHIESYLEADSFTKEGKTPLFENAYNKAKNGISNIESKANRLDEKKFPELKKLALMAKESMDNVRKSIVNEALGKKETGIAALRKSEDIATLAVYNVMITAKENSPALAILESKGAEYFVAKAASADAMKNKCENIDMNKMSELLNDSTKFSEYLVNDKAPVDRAYIKGQPEFKKDIQGPSIG